MKNKKVSQEKGIRGWILAASLLAVGICILPFLSPSKPVAETGEEKKPVLKTNATPQKAAEVIKTNGPVIAYVSARPKLASGPRPSTNNSNIKNQE